MKKKTLIAAAAVLLIGLCALLSGRLARQKTSDMMHLTDGSTGRSVVVEWSDSDMFFNELDACTNSVLPPRRRLRQGRRRPSSDNPRSAAAARRHTLTRRGKRAARGSRTEELHRVVVRL